MATKKATAKRAIAKSTPKKKKSLIGPRKVRSKVDGMPIIRRPKKRKTKVSM